MWPIALLLPSRCVCCGRSGVQFCDSCRAGLLPLTAPLCERCGAPTEWPVARCRECTGRRLAFASARAAVAYAGPAVPFIRAWKEGGLRPLAAPAAALVAERVPRPAATLITFVPADGDRSRRRGHEPPRALATALGQLWGMEVRPVLARARRVGRQTGLAPAERRRNVRGAFRAREHVAGDVILVDDVYTTGATASAAASALRATGARSVLVVTLARAVR